MFFFFCENWKAENIYLFFFVFILAQAVMGRELVCCCCFVSQQKVDIARPLVVKSIKCFPFKVYY